MYFSKTVENRLKNLSLRTNTLFSGEAITILSKNSKSKGIKLNKSNYEKLLGELPDGIYKNIKEVIEIIRNKTSVDTLRSTKYSTLVFDKREFIPCRTMQYSKGNIITGRDAEVDKILLTLGRKNKRGVILVGPAGVGKTAIVRSVNAKLKEGTVNRSLLGCTLHVMDLPYIFTKYKDDPLGTIVRILEAASKDDKHIIFSDETHALLTNKMNDILKPYLTEKIRFIGSTTIDEYHAIITADKALERRFTIINVDEPNILETTDMVSKTKTKYESYHLCSISDSVCKYLVENGSRFLGHRKNPDKALDILDMSCTVMNKEEVTTTIPIIEKCTDITTLDNNNNSIKAMETVAGNRILTEYYVDKGISSLTGINYNKIKNSLDYKTIVNYLKEKIIGQDKAIEDIANVSNIIRHVNYDQEKPLSTVLIVGGAGTGKSEACKNLTKCIFGSVNNFIDYDLGGLKSEFQLSELRGSPPGYVGYEKSGRLIKEIRYNPQSIVYFRNIDKCHEAISEYILTCIKNGRMIDAAEREVKLNNTIIVFSVTLSKEDLETIKNNKTMGFGKKVSSEQDLESKITKIVSKDIIDTVDSTVLFKTLSKETLECIYNINIDKYLKMYQDVDIDLKTLKKKVLLNADNGHDIIVSLSAQIPKLISNSLKSLEKGQ